MPETAEITKEILKKVRQVEIRSRRYVTESMVGASAACPVMISEAMRIKIV